MHGKLNSLSFNRKRTLAVVLSGLLLFGINSCNKTVEQTNTSDSKEQKMKIQIPQSIKAEHEELHRELENAVKSGGNTGEAAKEVANRLHAHFEKEEEYALPPLGLLSLLADGKVSAEMKETAKLSDKLKAELPQMLDEHKQIVVALDNLAKAAKSENKTDAVEFTEKLKMHARNEEEILYPAAILVGEYLKLRLKD
jgi:hypothetical protein